MALVKEMMGGCSMMEKSLFPLSSIRKSINHTHNYNHPCVNIRTRIPVVKAAISEDLARLVKAEEKAVVTFKVRAVLTVRNKYQEDFKETLVKKIDSFADQIIGRNVVLQLYSIDIDPKTRAPKKSKQGVLKDWSHKSNLKSEKVNYTSSDIVVDSDFGIPGAITITNNHQKELYLESITIEGFACGPLYFPANSWVHHPHPRIFFSNKPYLPDQTPAGLKLLRQKELKDLRGDGKGVRKLSDRIYDYDVYNDLGNPDRGNDFIRPLLGGQKIPYPRRCRTGRLPTDTGVCFFSSSNGNYG